MQVEQIHEKDFHTVFKNLPQSVSLDEIIQVSNLALNKKLSPKCSKLLMFCTRNEKNEITGILLVETKSKYRYMFAVDDQSAKLLIQHLASQTTQPAIRIVTRVKFSHITKEYFHVDSVPPFAIHILPKEKWEHVLSMTNLDIPLNMKIGPLQPYHTDKVVKYWKYSANIDDPHAYIRHAIENYCTVGLYLDDELVCWVLQHDDLSIGFLNTVEEHRQKVLLSSFTLTCVFL